ncbi:unnamed protein product [Periconia digitata]|uniref:Uncharacterized protein n=1 Tax=Periconia digitata TaxID=1303443 RepID=A0A9W4UAU0_9PLEO|nr:unnamed protein product [Periconia digitata]
MSSPSYPQDRFSTGGPSQSALQKLLEELADSSRARIRSRPDHDSLSCYKRFSRPSRSIVWDKPSVWVGGGIDAKDARNKLRAHDEARQKRKLEESASSSMLNVRLAEPQGSGRFPAKPPSSLGLGSTHDSAIAFGDAQFSTRRTSPARNQCPPAWPSPILPGSKRSYSPCDPLELKRYPRAETQKETTGTLANYASSASSIAPKGGGSNTTAALYNHADYVERLPPSRTLSASLTPLDGVSSFRPIEQKYRQPPTPPVPRHSYVSANISPETTTPVPIRPLQLTLDIRRSYKQPSDPVRRNILLCFGCYHQHGEFNVILEHGCEVCGGSNALTHHYWERLCRR